MEQISLREDPQRLTAGSKTGLEEMAMVLQSNFHRYNDLSISEALSKRGKHMGVCESGVGSDSSRISISMYHREKSDKFYIICSEYIQEFVVFISWLHCSLTFVPDNEVCQKSASAIYSTLRNLSELRWPLKKNQTLSANLDVEIVPCKLTIVIERDTVLYHLQENILQRVELPDEKPIATGWNSLPNDLRENILQRVELKDLFRFKVVSKSCKEYIESGAFSQWRGANSSQEGLFTAINYFIKNTTWRCTGFDLHSGMWRTLPPFSYLPPPDAELFKEYSVCGNGALMCADVAKLPNKGELVVFNPVTRKRRPLPPLPYPRSPVLVHISLNAATKSYKVIVAGSSNVSNEQLSKKIEVFDSNTSQWEEACDLPGPAFGLNEHQTGVCVNGILYFISFLEGNGRKGVVAFDVENRKWLEDMACPIPFSMYSNILQLVESDGKVYLFSEQEQGRSVEHCIDVLESPNPNIGAVEKCYWRNVVRVNKSGGRGLQVYPEHTCVSFREGKLCMFNTLTRDGVVYDMQDGREVEVLQPPPPEQQGEKFFSLNPATFTLQPSFDSDPIPLSVDAI